MSCPSHTTLKLIGRKTYQPNAAGAQRCGSTTQLHIALGMGRRITHNPLAGADAPRPEHRGGTLSQLHLAPVMGRSVTHNLLAGADGPRREHRGGTLSQLH